MGETPVTNDQSADSAVTNDQNNGTRVVKLRNSDIEWLLEHGNDGESPAVVLSRLRKEFTTYQEVVGVLNTEISAFKHRITGLEADIERLIDAAPTTALTPIAPGSANAVGGEAVKGVMDELKDVCNDDEVCIKNAINIVEKQADLMNSQNSRDHDRDERDKDRKLKQDLADSKAKHEKDLALIKKGIVQEGDLEGVVFLGEHRHKSAKAAIEEQKEQARRESDEDEEWDAPSGED